MAKLGTQYGDLMVSKKVDDVVMYLFENMEHDWMGIMPDDFADHIYDAMKVAMVRYFRQDGNQELVDEVLERFSSVGGQPLIKLGG